MKKIKRYCDKQKRILLKLIRKMFNYSLVDAIEVETEIQRELEKEFNMSVEKLNWSEIKKSSTAPKKFAKYKTLKCLIDAYINVDRIYTFSNDMEILNG